MDKLKLILPTEEYKDQVLRYKNDMINAGSSMDGCGDLRKLDIDEWLQNCKDWRVGKRLPEGYVPSTQFICIRENDNKLVGMLDIRHKFSDFLFNYGGLIGDSIAVDERGKGYGKEILRLGLEKAKEIGLNKVLVSCLDTNVPSRKCIKANGGVYEDTRQLNEKKLERYWIDLSKEDTREL